MASSGGLLAECAQQLKGSPHDYEKLLGSCVESVWRTVGTSVERQLRLRKGVGVPSLGKFAFVRDLQPLTPVFLLADRFTSSYGVVWWRPPPALLTPVTELNMSVVGSEAGGLPKDQVSKTLDALLAFIGTKLQKGVASGRVRLGNVGTFSFDGKAMAFQFDIAFVTSITAASPQSDYTERLHQPSQAPHPTLTEKLQPTKAITTMPRAVSLQVLAPVEKLPLPMTTENVQVQATESHHKHESKHRRISGGDSGDRHHRKHDHSPGQGGTKETSESRRDRDRQTKSMTQLSTPSSELSDSSSAGQILPRFMLPDSSRSSSKLVYAKQAAALQRTFEFKRDELQHEQAQRTQQEDEVRRRTDATRLRAVQERAEKTVNQRDLDAFLTMQIESNDREHRRQAALDAASTDFDAVRVLPRDLVVTKEQRQASKNKLRGRLHDQVALKDSLAKQRQDVDRAESAYFMAKVLEQGERERDQRNELRRVAREALTAGWQQQCAIHEQCEQLRRPVAREAATKRC